MGERGEDREHTQRRGGNRGVVAEAHDTGEKQRWRACSGRWRSGTVTGGVRGAGGAEGAEGPLFYRARCPRLFGRVRQCCGAARVRPQAWGCAGPRHAQAELDGRAAAVREKRPTGLFFSLFLFVFLHFLVSFI